MANNKFSLVVYLIIALAIIGIVTQMVTNPASFIGTIMMMIGFGAAIFAVIYFVFLRNKNNSNDAKKYKKAVKQSKSKYKQPTNKQASTASKKTKPLKMKKKHHKRASHLRVIDGNKSKRKDRATF